MSRKCQMANFGTTQAKYLTNVPGTSRSIQTCQTNVTRTVWGHFEDILGCVWKSRGHLFDIYLTFVMERPKMEHRTFWGHFKGIPDIPGCSSREHCGLSHTCMTSIPPGTLSPCMQSQIGKNWAAACILHIIPCLFKSLHAGP